MLFRPHCVDQISVADFALAKSNPCGLGREVITLTGLGENRTFVAAIVRFLDFNAVAVLIGSSIAFPARKR